jgi:hypothetical protein
MKLDDGCTIISLSSHVVLVGPRIGHGISPTGLFKSCAGGSNQSLLLEVYRVILRNPVVRVSCFLQTNEHPYGLMMEMGSSGRKEIDANTWSHVSLPKEFMCKPDAIKLCIQK